MALAKWTCLDCEKEFSAGKWVCQSGQNHRVVMKRYYMNDAPTVVSLINGHATVNKRDSATMVMNIPPERRVMGNDGHEQVVPGGQAYFVRGIFETDNPEKQYWLDQHKGVFTGDHGKALWEAAYLNDDEKMQIQRMEFEAEKTRFEHEKNALLAQVQSRA